jgi:hypothetical protein
MNIKKLSIPVTLFSFMLILAGASVHAEKTPLSYKDYAFVLKTYVNGRGMVNYKDLKAHRSRLDNFAHSLAQVRHNEYKAWTKEDKIAFWINAYNGLTLIAIINNYPIRPSFVTSLVYPKNSIRQISGVWDELTFNIMGTAVTLDETEHKRLRRDFNEPRIHMALVCAAKSCPPLRNEPYKGSQLDAQLKDQTVTFLNNPENFRISPEEGKIYLSSIFKWFGEDFIVTYGGNEKFNNYGEKEGAVLNFIVQHLDKKEQQYLLSHNYSIEYLDYDWSLNEQKE